MGSGLRRQLGRKMPGGAPQVKPARARLVFGLFRQRPGHEMLLVRRCAGLRFSGLPDREQLNGGLFLLSHSTKIRLVTAEKPDGAVKLSVFWSAMDVPMGKLHFVVALPQRINVIILC
jgi:hypothetical protein